MPTPPLDLRTLFSDSLKAEQLDDAALSGLQEQFGDQAPVQVDAVQKAVEAWRKEESGAPEEGTRASREAGQRIGEALQDLQAAIAQPA